MKQKIKKITVINNQYQTLEEKIEVLKDKINEIITFITGEK